MKKFFPILFLTIISAFLIFYRFPAIPKYLAYDEVEFTKLALSLDKKPYTPYSQLATGHSTLYFYILLALLKTFGINVFALRLPAAIFGILSVIIFYLIVKDVFQRLDNKKSPNFLISQFPFFFAFILLSSRWFLNFSRFSFEATFLLFLELTSIFFLMLANAKKPLSSPRRHKNLLPSISSSFYIMFSGIFAGFAFLSYTPGRIFFILPIGFIILNWYRRGMPRLYDKKILIKQFFLFIIPFIIIITPLTNYLMINKDNRIDKLFFWRNNEITVNEKIIGTANNIKSITLMFFTNGDMNGKHNYPGKPALNPILGILFIIGLITTMKQWNNNSNKLFLFYFLISIFPSLAIYPWENPNMLRTFTVIPSVIYFIGTAIYHLSSIVQRWSLNKKIYRYLILNTFYLILIFSSFYELRTYFKYQSKVFNDSFEIKWPLDKAIKLKNPYEKVP